MNNCSCFLCQFQRNGFEHCCHSARECTVCSYIPAMGVFAYAQLHSQTLQQLHSLCTCVCTLQLFFVFGSQTQGIAHCSCASVSYEHYAPVREHVAEFHVLLNACASVQNSCFFLFGYETKSCNRISCMIDTIARLLCTQVL